MTATDTKILHGNVGLTDVITLREPLGPSFTEALINTNPGVFGRLYDGTSHAHRETRVDDPSYIVGRKGSGKTAFLLGGALAHEAEVVLLKSEDVFFVVDKLRQRYAATHGALVTDNLVNVWEVLLFHAAMWQIAVSERIPYSEARGRVWTYMSAFGDPVRLEPDTLLARVAARLADSLLTADDGLSFREACWSIDAGRGPLEEAAISAREILADVGSDAVYVVIDNLEDLHRHLHRVEDVVTALLRVTSRAPVVAASRRLPFKTRFAFPAELLPRLRVLAANAEKDFLHYVKIKWTAAELIVVAGNRLRMFLDLYFEQAPKALGLPEDHDPADREAAERTLRALLPATVPNGLGSEEDPVAYIMRHTQLLPRQLIQILNEIVQQTARRTPKDRIPRVTHDEIYEGIRAAEGRIVEAILSTDSYEFPALRG
jgi:hypothetical protein